MSESDASAMWSELRESYPHEPSLPKRGFGSDALTANGRMFATLHHGKLMLKLPSERADSLIETSEAERLVMKGRAMREWVLVPPISAADWRSLTEEARAFVSSLGPATPRRRTSRPVSGRTA